MDFIKIHFNKLKFHAFQIQKEDLSEWLLNHGYYPDSYVLPPCFSVKNFKLKKKNITLFPPLIARRKFKKPAWKDTEKVIFPKNTIMDRVFGVIHPDIYHDLVYYISENWTEIVEHLFKTRNLVCYSFPVPVESNLLNISRIKRTERLIYDYIEMAEKDLVADSIGYDYIIHADIKNFYPSIYTHSISWALHGKDFIQNGKIGDYRYLGNILDALIFSGNGGSTNGIPVGSVVSDILAEIVLAKVDFNICKEIDKKKIKYTGVRYKDDYRILCKSEDEGKKILKIMQQQLFKYNLSLNESKTNINQFPDGLYRPWIIEYNSYKKSTDKNGIMTFKNFELLYFHAIKVHKKFPQSGVLKKFLGQIISSNNKLIIHIENRKNALKLINLIWNLRKEKIICLPEILGIFEILLSGIFIDSPDIETVIINEVENLYNSKDTLGTYEIIWLSYFIKANNIQFSSKNPLKGSKNKIFKSINSNKNFLFGEIHKSKSKAKIFTRIEDSKTNYPYLIDWVGLFR